MTAAFNGEDDSWCVVASALPAAEVGFFEDLLERNGIPAAVAAEAIADRTSGSTYRISVPPGRQQEAEAVLQQADRDDGAAREAPQESGTRGIGGCVIGGILGFAFGARIGRHIAHGTVVALVTALTFGAIGVWFGRRTRER